MHRPLSMGLVVFTALLSGCETLREVAGGVQKPAARIRDANLQDLTAESVALAVDVEVTNPYAVALPLLDLDYRIESGGAVLASGRADLDGSIAPRASRTLTIPATLRFSEILGVLGGVRPGEIVPYLLDAALSVDAGGLGTIALPLRTEGELPIPAVPKVELTRMSWESLSLQEATAVLRLRVTNTNSFTADLTELAYGLSLADLPVIETTVAQRASFAAGAARELAIPVSFRPMDLGIAAMRVLGGEGASYRLAGTMSFDTPFGPIALPYEQAGETFFSR